jgi:hypothetical protein
MTQEGEIGMKSSAPGDSSGRGLSLPPVSYFLQVYFILSKNQEDFNSIRGQKIEPNRSGIRLNREDPDQVLSTVLIGLDM